MLDETYAAKHYCSRALILPLNVHASLALAINQSCPYITDTSSLYHYKFMLSVADKETCVPANHCTF